ncbi:gliding motility-associated C-terminal domain-containing protein [Hymenobacter sp. ASUV-10]|uniref:Gliding motility-associated C-terminal domain-containing protein n=1 Tax=Hymenobacter aranciens TaxID=3063996 RepID=A0ABT9BHF7_9BACT|nr:gliding motility-associated C-terminal domain-containing protein [Hymenobacter sp. ASUV-10]MDO7877697.1 gliding motility-associated C-terminal domain-containing protein [Hymenobacter sp. ASUV-10]
MCGLAPNNVQLEVLQGTVTTFPLCNGSQPGTFVYTPTAAGPITIYANGNSGNPGDPALFFYRNFQVFDSPTPDFDVAGCLNNNTLITLKPGSSYDRYIANFDGGPQRVPLMPGTANVVASGGATGVTVVGFYNDNTLCRDSLRKSFTLPPTPTPLSFNRLTQAPRAGTAATVTVAGLQSGYQYSIIREDAAAPGGFSTVLDLPASTAGTATLPGAAQGCYRLRRVDACQLQPATSDPICALDLSVTAVPGQNVLSVSYSGAGASAFRIERNGTLLTTLPAVGPYTDAAVLCGSSYTYRVTAVLPNGAESVSNEGTVTALSNNIPPPVPPLVASFTLNNTVSLTPVLASPRVPRGSVLRYRKTVGSRPARDFASDTTGRAIADPTSFDSLRVAPPCYTVRFVDVCGNSSAESSPTCPAFLTATPADNEGNTVNLSWTNFTGPDPAAPTSYELLRLAPDGSTLSTLPVSGNSVTDFTPPADRQVLRYRLRISGGGIPADTVSYSNVASVARRVRLQLPTAFTPNGDGLNDVLEVKGRFLENYSFVVVDRNGMEVFNSTQRSETWDGRIKSRAPVNGAYVWRFQQIDETGKLIRETGTITILQ